MKWRFRVGYFKSEQEALSFLNSDLFASTRGVVLNDPKVKKMAMK